jgi:hypothetical protein
LLKPDRIQPVPAIKALPVHGPGIPRDRIAKKSGNAEAVLRDHLAEMAVLPNPPNADLKSSPSVLPQSLKHDLINVLAVSDGIHHHPGVGIIDPVDNPETFQFQGSEQDQFVLQRFAKIWIFMKPFESGFDIFPGLRVQAGKHISRRSRQFYLKYH